MISSQIFTWNMPLIVNKPLEVIQVEQKSLGEILLVETDLFWELSHIVWLCLENANWISLHLPTNQTKIY